MGVKILWQKRGATIVKELAPSYNTWNMADLEEKKFKNQNTTSHILGGGILTIYFPFGNKRKVDLPLCLCLCLLICLSVCLPACLPASLSLSQYLSVSWSLGLYLLISLGLFWCFTISRCLLFHNVSVCLLLSLPLSLLLCLSVCLPACLALSLSLSLSVCLSLSLSLFCRTGGSFSQHKLNKYSMMLCIKEVWKYSYISSNPSMQPGHECPVLTGIVNPCYSSLLPLFIFGMLVE